MGIDGWVSRWAALRPAEPALVFGERTITWADLDASVDRVAGVLAAHGVGKGDRVGVYLKNCPEFLEVFFGAVRLGAIVVLVNHFLTEPEVRWLVGDAGIDVMCAGPEFTPVDGVRHWLTPDDLAVPAAPVAPVVVEHSDTAVLLYTSGTTGFPKGAVTSHGAIHFSTVQWMVHVGFRPGRRHLVHVPLSFTGGSMAGVMPAIHSGGTIVLEPGFDPGRALELVEQHHINHTMGVSLMWQAMADHPRFADTDLSSLQECFVGGGPVPLPLLEIWQERGVPFIQSFSITEGNSLCLALPPEDAVRKRGSCGLPLLYCDADVRADDGSSCGPDEVGELVLTGPVLFDGYWCNPDATAKTLVDGWLHTGDLARRDADGYYTIVDRKGDLIISGGLNVYPAEVEAALHGFPGLSEVAVVGLPDEKWGERVTAVVVRRPDGEVDADAVIAHCASTLASYKVPKEIRFVDALPRTMSGKVQRRKLREGAS